MALLSSNTLWAVLALSVAIPVVAIVGARFLAYRMAGRPRAVAIAAASSFPTIRIALDRRLLRRLLLLLCLAPGTITIVLRYFFGIGPVTNLSNATPWGFWIGFDVMGGVALGAGAFVLAACGHIFHVKRLEPLVRPAILTGLLGYLLVILGLAVDLGRPWNIWRPVVHWQHRSVMWEVGMCVTFYTIVLFIEFLPVILERVNQFESIARRLPTVPLYRLLRRISIVFVILGVILSTLHQSSLGSLWVLLPTKLHPLWYSIWLPVFFWFSAVAVGFAMTIVESTLSSRAFGRGLETPLLVTLGKGAAVTLGIYLALRIADLVARDALVYLFQPTVQAAGYWLEIVLGTLVPIAIFSVKRWRDNPRTLFGGAALVVVFGILLNRVNISTIGLWDYTGVHYLPSLPEISVSVALVTYGVIAFWLIGKYLPVFPDAHDVTA